MLDMKKVLAGAAVAAGSLVSTQALAETTGSLNITSEYMFRGVVSSGGAAVQGSFDWSAPSGIYAGSWVSNTSPVVPGTELDLYAGWAGDMGNGLGVDVGFVYYGFPEQDELGPGVNDFDYWEVYGGLSYGGLSGSIYYADDYFGFDGQPISATQTGDGSMIYVTLAYTANIKEGLDMTFQIGNSSGEGVEAFLFAGGSTESSYTDWSITTSKDIGDGWGVSGAYVQTDIEAGSIDDEAKFVVSLSKEFAL